MQNLRSPHEPRRQCQACTGVMRKNGTPNGVQHYRCCNCGKTEADRFIRKARREDYEHRVKRDLALGHTWRWIKEDTGLSNNFIQRMARELKADPADYLSYFAIARGEQAALPSDVAD